MWIESYNGIPRYKEVECSGRSHHGYYSFVIE
jgi:hypothetical protein